MEAGQPRARPEERPWRPGLRTGPCYLQPTSQKAEREVPGVKDGPLPASPQLRCVFRGQRVPCMWGAPAWKGRGPGSNSKVFQAWAEAKFSCLGIRLAGGLGGGQGGSPQPLKKEGSCDRGAGAWPWPDACDSGSSLSICPGDPEAERPVNGRRHRVGGRMGFRGSIPPRT